MGDRRREGARGLTLALVQRRNAGRHRRQRRRILWFDLRGIASHGTARLPQYQARRRERSDRWRVRSKIAGRRRWPGSMPQRLGPSCRAVATDDAIARQRGQRRISMFANTNHYGIAGWYTMRNARETHQGRLTNTSPGRSHAGSPRCSAPARSRSRRRRAARHARADSHLHHSRGRRVAARRRPPSVGWAIGPDGSRPDAGGVAGALQPWAARKPRPGTRGTASLSPSALTGIPATPRWPEHHGLSTEENRTAQFSWRLTHDAFDDRSGLTALTRKAPDQLTTKLTDSGARAGSLSRAAEAEQEAASLRHGRDPDSSITPRCEARDPARDSVSDFVSDRAAWSSSAAESSASRPPISSCAGGWRYGSRSSKEPRARFP